MSKPTFPSDLLQLAQELGYTVADSRKPGSSEWQEHISEVAATTKLSGRQVWKALCCLEGL